MKNALGQKHLPCALLLVAAMLMLWPLAGVGQAQRPATQHAAQQLAFGQTETGFISAPAEVDSFTFVASTGDVILIGASRSSGDLWPRIRLYQPGGLLLQDKEGAYHAEVSQALPADGTYSVHISDGFDGTNTGGYGLYLQRLNNPGNATPVSFGETTTGFISQVAEMHTYTFEAQEGDTILVGISRASGDLWPEIRLYDPEGNLAGVDNDAYHAEITIVVSRRFFAFLPLILKNHGGTTIPAEGTQEETRGIRVRASLPGTYTILAADGYNGTWTGGYGLHVQRLNNPGNATAIGFGQTPSGNINQVAEMDAYTFAANAGDVVLVGASRSSGDLWPEVRLFDPEGALVGIASGSYHAEVQTTLASAGTYTALVSDGYNGTSTGGYGLHVQRLNNPGNATALAYGDLEAATINLAAEMDAYTFAANAGDSILISMARTSGNLWPEVRLFDPHGEPVGTDEGATLAELDATLAKSGTYTILAADGYNGTSTGGYDLELEETAQ